jgi:serine/threonine-protein kinase HipA
MSQPKRCLSCYEPLDEALRVSYHPGCSKRMFGRTVSPDIDIRATQLEQLGRQLMQQREAVTGVQPKLSLGLRRGRETDRLTLLTQFGSGDFILKPPFDRYPQLPEVEDLTMHLAADAGLRVAPHCLVKLTPEDLTDSVESLAYLTHRFDRPGESQRLAMEDMAQLNGKLAVYKYQGSLEQIGKVIARFSSFPGQDALEFFTLNVFCFLTGNADMHLKNFSLLTQADGMARLSPAYDLVATKLVNPADDEDTALTLNERKKRLKPADFTALANSLNIPYTAVRNVYVGLQKRVPAWRKRIDASFLNEELQANYHALLSERLERLGMIA